MASAAVQPPITPPIRRHSFLLAARTRPFFVCWAVGFSVLELVFVLAVSGILMVVAAGVVQQFSQRGNRVDSEAILQTARRNLQAFLVAERRLPCPDIAGDGYEGDAAGVCPKGTVVGGFPYLALGMEVPKFEGDRRIRYGVWREDATSDLVMRAAKEVYGLSQVGGQWADLIARLTVASKHKTTLLQPYIAANTSGAAHADCQSALFNPAAVIEIVESKGAEGNCFVDDSTHPLQALGAMELLGWARDDFRE